MRFNYMICPVQDLSTSVFSNIKCQPNHVFVWHQLPIPASVTTLLEQIVRIFSSPGTSRVLLTPSTCDYESRTADPQAHHGDPVCAIPTALDRPRRVRVARRSLRRLLRVGLQARRRHQRLWQLAPRPRRFPRPHGLPVPDGTVHVRVPLVARARNPRVAVADLVGVCDLDDRAAGAGARDAQARRRPQVGPRLSARNPSPDRPSLMSAKVRDPSPHSRSTSLCLSSTPCIPTLLDFSVQTNLISSPPSALPLRSPVRSFLVRSSQLSCLNRGGGGIGGKRINDDIAGDRVRRVQNNAKTEALLMMMQNAGTRGGPR